MKKLPTFFITFALFLGLVLPAFAAVDDFYVYEGRLSHYYGSGGDVVIPDGVTSVGSRAFYNCSSLTSVIIPSSVTEIGEQAFYGCYNLSKVVIEDGTTEIGDSAFAGCTSLTSIEIPNSVTKIGSGVFSGCTGLTDISIPDNVTEIAGHTFYGCTGLKTITIGNGVTSIESLSFKDCTSLTSVTIGTGIKEIASYAFGGCTNLTTLTFGAGKIAIGENAFSDTPWGKDMGGFALVNSVLCVDNDISSVINISDNDFTIRGDGVLTKYKGDGGDVVIPKGVTAIGNSAFRFCESITSVVIPDGVTEIGDQAFWNCTNLTSVVIPDGMTKIGAQGFSNCSSLANVIIPDSVTEIGERAFSYCTGLASATIGSSVSSIETGVFESCTNLTSVIIPDSVTKIGNFSFMDCTSLASILIGNSVVSIESQAFQGCSSLLTVAIPDSVEKIGTSSFNGCTNLASVFIGNGVVSIENGAFRGCSSLTAINIPASVEKIGEYVFRGCESLTSVTFPTEGTLVEKWSTMDSRDFADSLFTTTINESVDPNTHVIHYQYAFLSSIIELVNCPNKELLGNLQSNQAILEQWLNPGQFITAQGESITTLSNQICNGLTSDYERAKAIFDWVTTNIEYDYDYYNGLKKGVTIYPESVLASRLTVCDGYARLTQSLLQVQHIPTLYVSGLADNGTGMEGHAWNLALVDDRWIYIDSTWGRFDPTELSFSIDHRGNKVLADPNSSSFYVASYSDTPSNWAQSEVRSALYAGLVPADIQSAYRDNITREEFCRLMVVLLEKSTGQSMNAYLKFKGIDVKNVFTDTNSSDVSIAYALGIVSGVSETKFNPGGFITRQEAATMLSRTAKVLGVTAAQGETFHDADQFASWAKESITFVSGLTSPTTNAKVMGETGNGNFSPTAPFSREQAIVTLLRLYYCTV